MLEPDKRLKKNKISSKKLRSKPQHIDETRRRAEAYRDKRMDPDFEEQNQLHFNEHSEYYKERRVQRAAEAQQELNKIPRGHGGAIGATDMEYLGGKVNVLFQEAGELAVPLGVFDQSTFVGAAIIFMLPEFSYLTPKTQVINNCF